MKSYSELFAVQQKTIWLVLFLTTVPEFLKLFLVFMGN